MSSPESETDSMLEMLMQLLVLKSYEIAGLSEAWNQSPVAPVIALAVKVVPLTDVIICGNSTINAN